MKIKDQGVSQSSFVMDKKYIVRFLKAKKRGAYKFLVEMYADVVSSMAVTMALEIIREDLEKESGESVVLNYFSLAQAIAKYKKISSLKSGIPRKWEFRDANETKDQLTPGKFKIG
ncbi:MAG: hypothetical protein ABL895_03595 [Cyclobacteriaceae bacterium]